MADGFNVNDLCNVFMKRMKSSYHLSIKGNRIDVLGPKLFVPFGIEEYNGKRILNIELDPTKSNEEYNLIVLLENIEKFFIGLSDQSNHCVYNPNIPLNSFIGKYYIHNMKKRYEKVHIRTHLMDNDKHIVLGNLRGKYISAKLILDRVWVNKSDYGILWYITNINVIE